jgi:monoamine oxidase
VQSTPSPAPHEVDVAVVGAGLAGLTCARDLQRGGLSVGVFEARERVGGRVFNQALANGVVVERGGQFVGPTQDRILALATELGVETFPTYDTGEGRIRVRGREDVALAKFADVVETLDAMAAELPLEEPWTAARAAEWDGQTLCTWLDANVADTDAAALLRQVVAAVFTAEAEELSFLHVLVYIRSAGSMGSLTQTEGGAQERRFVGGAQLVAERLAEELGAGTVTLSSPVRGLASEDGSVTVTTDSGVTKARRVVVAVPIALADRIAYSPALPAHRAQLHQRAVPGTTIKTTCVYESAFWREDGWSGRLFTDEGPVTVTFDNSPDGGRPGMLVSFAEADFAREFRRLSAGERRQATIDCLVANFGPAAAEPVEYVETDWSNEEWTRGCFGANFGPGGWTRYGNALREPCGLVHWAGAETSPIWMNYMDGAVRSGERAAAEVVAALA